jgi:hypothetical protein
MFRFLNHNNVGSGLELDESFLGLFKCKHVTARARGKELRKKHTNFLIVFLIIRGVICIQKKVLWLILTSLEFSL